jgi:hypothetical protein
MHCYFNALTIQRFNALNLKRFNAVTFSETSNDRNCAGCQVCCLDYKCWLRTQDILFSVINDPLFDFVVTLCIILNTVFLAIEHHGMSEDLKHVLDTGNKVSTSGIYSEQGTCWTTEIDALE